MTAGYVEIVDDTLRENVSFIQKDGLGRLHFMLAKTTSTGIIHLPAGEKQFGAKQVQRTARSTKVFEGRGLELAVRRARRWMNKRRKGGAPRHIALAMAAFHKSDPAGFRDAMKGT